MMKDIERLMIERECERLVTQYCHLVDHGEAEKIADLFTEDGVWKSALVTMDGRDMVRKGFRVRQDNKNRMSRHVCNNLKLDVIDNDHVEGVVYLTLYRYDGEPERRTSPLEQPEIVGEYRDRFVRTQEGWRFAHREVKVSFIHIPEQEA